MFISEAFAQTAAPGMGGLTDILGNSFLVPLMLMFGIMYFFMIRPQQKKAKDHQALLKALRRGDTVVTQGGMVAKITKVIDDEQIEIELSEGVRVRQLRGMIVGVRAKSEPAKDEASAS